MLTAAHGVQGNSNATAWISGSRYLAKVLATDTNLDVALLQLEEDKPFKHLSLSNPNLTPAVHRASEWDKDQKKRKRADYLFTP